MIMKGTVTVSLIGGVNKGSQLHIRNDVRRSHRRICIAALNPRAIPQLSRGLRSYKRLWGSSGNTTHFYLV